MNTSNGTCMRWVNARWIFVVKQESYEIAQNCWRNEQVTEPGNQSWNIFHAPWLYFLVLGDKDAVKINIVCAVVVELSKDADVLLSNTGSDMKLSWKRPEIWNVT